MTMLNSMLGDTPETRALSIVRIAVSAMLIIHGITRMALGIVDDFGGFLGGIGFPLGSFIAWIITIVEIAGGMLLALGKFRFLLSIYFALQLLIGIILVHASEGWFVVGAGRNGMEYSFILIVCLCAIAYAARTQQIRKKT